NYLAPMPASTSRAHLGMVLVALIWGVNFTTLKLGIRALGVLPFTAFRFVLASAALWLLTRQLGRATTLPRRTFWILVGLGVLGNTLYQVLFMTGLSMTSATNSAMIVAALPVLVAVMGTVLGLEESNTATWIGVVLGSVGVGLVVAAKGVQFSGASVAGDLIVLVAMLCWAGYTLGVRQAGSGLDPLHVTSFTTLAGTPGLLILGAPGLVRADWASVGLVGWLAIAYAAFLAIVVAYYLYNGSVQVLGSSGTALYNCLVPLVAMTVAWLALDERPVPQQLVGGALVIISVLVSALGPRALTARDRARAFRDSPRPSE
ncbi:MAG: DMT family transporter, partial [Gemmatimonadales bacterium]